VYQGIDKLSVRYLARYLRCHGKRKQEKRKKGHEVPPDNSKLAEHAERNHASRTDNNCGCEQDDWKWFHKYLKQISAQARWKKP
jgi:hypothetical protein